MSKEIRWSQFLNDLSVLTPGKVWLTNVKVAETVDPTALAVAPGTTGPAWGTTDIGTITFEGKGYTHNDVASWLKALASEKGVADPYFTNSTQEQIGTEDSVTFESQAVITEDPSPAGSPTRRAADMTDTRKWSALAAVLVVAIFAAGWFLLISPKRGDAADLRGKAASKSQENARLQEQIAMLQEQQKGLPTQRAQLAAMRAQIPTNPALPSLIRDLTAAGKKAGVSIDSMAPTLPVALVAAPSTTLAAPTTTGAAAGSTGSTAGKKAATHAPVPTSTLFKVPLSLRSPAATSSWSSSSASSRRSAARSWWPASS